MKLPTFAKTVTKRARFLQVVFSLLTLMLYMLPIGRLANAATLTTPRDYLNRQQYNQVSGTQHEVFFTATTAVWMSRIQSVFPLGYSMRQATVIGT